VPGDPPLLPPPAPLPAAGGGAPKWLWPVLVGLLVVALVAVGLVVLGDDDEQAGAGEIFLEPAATMGDDPFSDASFEADTIPTSAPSTTEPPRSTTTGSSTAVRSVPGGQVGLYGGTGNQSRCDVDGMSAFLQRSPDQAAAFVAALNTDPTLRWSGGTQVTVAQLPAYLDELTPVTLTRDTRVTNHGFSNGRPTPRQSVLQAGTAVLIDRYGVPRARCACGNPLIPPQRITTTPRYTGPPWPGFAPTTVVVVTEVDVEIDVFVLVDLVTGDLFERPAGTTGSEDEPAEPPEDEEPTTTTTDEAATTTTEGPELGTGDVQVTLTWTGDLDLDLHVVDPSGAEIYFGSPTSATGGQLDVDKIPSSGDSGPHVENVFWPTGGAPPGAYQATVEALSGYTSTSADFTLEVFVDGELVDQTGGPLASYATSETITFEF
jgi:hypothetical protein